MHILSFRLTDYPVKKSFSAIGQTLGNNKLLALESPTGSGKTTLIPLLMLEHGLSARKILITQPRRLAAKSTALRMAELTQTEAGKLVGYRLRGESRTSPETRIEVVTEGYACAMLQADPFMSDYDWIIIDEFHERHLDGDLLLASMRDLHNSIGADDSPGIILMTATWQGQPVEALSEFSFYGIDGSLHPVEKRFYRGNSSDSMQKRLDWGINRALEDTDGKVLVFLPGRREIDTAFRQLSAWKDPIEISMLFGGMELSAQQQVMYYSGPARQIILATAVAETSLTIEGVTAVVDSGLERLPLYRPQTGLTHLITRRVSRATADQRTGRAGRLCPGTAYRLWSESEDRELIDRWDPEILTGDLSRARLQTLLWNNGSLPWLTPPPGGKWKQAEELLKGLEAVDRDGKITERGRQLARIPLHPRLAHMVISAPDIDEAALVAAVLSEGYRFKLKGTLAERTATAKSRGDLVALRKEAGLIRARIESNEESLDSNITPGGLISLAYPDRIGRKTGVGRYELINGRGLQCGESHFEWAVFPEITGSEDRLAAPWAEELQLSEIRALHPALFSVECSCSYEPENGKFRTECFELIGRLKLKSLPSRPPDPDGLMRALKNALGKRGIEALPLDEAGWSLINRLNTAASAGLEDMPSGKHDILIEEAGEWLLPFISADLSRAAVAKALRSRMSWEQTDKLDKLFPESIELRPEQRKKIDYSNPEQPRIRGRLQEFYGLTGQFRIASGKIPIAVELLSPAMRPLQITTDLTAFWKGSYAQIRGEMKGRYPKHFWPESPENASPSLATGKNRPEE